MITRQRHGVISETRLGKDFFDSSEYRSMQMFGERYPQLKQEDELVIRRGDRAESVADFGAALNWLLEQARKGLNLQRYKGLGEMNPDQLWETTMDPQQRRLLKVAVEDDVSSDDTFTVLMGDQVEPRRDFIEKNAFLVTNLDV